MQTWRSEGPLVLPGAGAGGRATGGKGSGTSKRGRGREREKEGKTAIAFVGNKRSSGGGERLRQECKCVREIDRVNSPRLRASTVGRFWSHARRSPSTALASPLDFLDYQPSSSDMRGRGKAITQFLPLLPSPWTPAARMPLAIRPPLLFHDSPVMTESSCLVTA